MVCDFCGAAGCMNEAFLALDNRVGRHEKCSPVAPAHRGVSRRALAQRKSPSGLAAKVPTRVGQLGVARAPEAAAAPTTSPGPRDLGRRPGTLVVDLGGAQRGLDGPALS